MPNATQCGGAMPAHTPIDLLSAAERQAIYRAANILKRVLVERPIQFDAPKAVADFLQFGIALDERESFVCLWLDAQHRLIEAETLFAGTLTQTSVYPREVVKAALAHNAAAVILAHNHPSGVIEPSSADLSLTDNLKHALALVDVKVLDHFIVGGASSPLSLAEHCYWPFGVRQADGANGKRRQTTTPTKATRKGRRNDLQ